VFPDKEQRQHPREAIELHARGLYRKTIINYWINKQTKEKTKNKDKL
jgi:hypothetical protein